MDGRVLFVCPHREDAWNVSRMLGPAHILCDHVASCQEARSRLTDGSYDAVLTEAYLRDGDWKDVLNLTFDLGQPPAVVVTHRVADDRFWAEVLNLGCYDMLAQPFDTREVQRILALACAQNRRRPMGSAESAARTLSNAG